LGAVRAESLLSLHQLGEHLHVLVLHLSQGLLHVLHDLQKLTGVLLHLNALHGEGLQNLTLLSAGVDSGWESLSLLGLRDDLDGLVLFVEVSGDPGEIVGVDVVG
jgi:hypothetical protein